MKRVISLLLVACLLFPMLPIMALAETSAGSPVLSIESVYGKPGDTVVASVELTGNPGIITAEMAVSFDSELKLISATNGDAFSALDFTAPDQLESIGYVSSPCVFTWGATDIDEESIQDGTILAMTFEISDDAEVGKTYSISISCDEVTDKNLNQFTLSANTEVMVIDYLPGDANGDGAISVLDGVWISRYIVDGRKYDPEGYAVQINESAADVNNDGKITMLDAVLIRRYIVDGRKYDPDGYAVKLLPSTPKCSHTMEAIAYKAATCTEDGNISYYHCTTCNKYYNDSNGTTEITLASTVLAATGHTAVTDPYVAPTYDSVGWTEGSHCSTCGEILVAQEEIPMLELNSYDISYSFTDSDPYLQKLVEEGTLVNDNPTTYTERDSITLINLSVPGYVFEGWYDGQGSNATQIKTISNQTGNMQLYAHWSKVTYTVTFDSPDVPVDSITYTVDTGATFTNPTHFGYTFVGWSKDGKILSSIPVGTIGNITLHANWTSNRNQATAVSSLGDPIIIEDWNNGQYLFVYEIGTIENVPLAEIWDFGNSQGITINDSYTYSQTVSESYAETIAKTIANATTKTSAWTLSSEWNDTTSATNEHEEEVGKTNQTTDSYGNVVEGKYYISNSNGGVTSTTASAGGSNSTSAKVTTGESTGINGQYTRTNQDDTSVSVDVGHTESTTDSSKWNVGGSATLQYTPPSIGVNAEVAGTGGGINVAGGWGGSGTISGGYESGSEDTTEDSTNVGVQVSESDIRSASLAASRTTNFGTENSSSSEAHWDTSNTASSSWNTTSGYEQAASTSQNVEVANAISEVIYDRYGYTSTNSRGGGTASTESTGESQELTDEYASTVEYLSEEQTEISRTITRSSDATGYYRLVTAGTVHVFAVVGYDIATNSYYVYTYNVLDEERHEYLDYSKSNANFNDCENAILSFEVPYEVHEFISTVMAQSEGIVVDYDTGYIVEYSGSATNVVVPQYVSVDNGDGTYSAIRVRGIDAAAFSGNTNITGIVLPKYVAEIPEGAFSGCTSLETVIGYGISEIGANAFSGCTALKNFSVDKYISALGENAFENVSAITVVAANESVAEAAINSGADSITLDISGLSAFDNRVITVSDSTEYFALVGNSSNGVTYKNLRIESDAAETFISNMTFVDNKNTPLKFGSEKVTLARVTVENAPGFAVIMTADNVALDLYGTVSLSSSSDNAVISKNVTLAKSNANVAGSLNLTGNYLICGEIANTSMLTFTSGEIVYLTEEEYESMLTSSVLTLNPNGGSVDVTEKLIYYGRPYGDLPTPSRTGYNFAGWYTAASGGTQVTADTVVTVLANQTLYAHWDAMAYTASWNSGTGYTIAVKRTSSPYAGAVTGTLSSGAMVYYGDVLSISYTKADYYSISSHGETAITVTDHVTSSQIYAVAELNPISAWTLASEVPADAQTVNTKWSYVLTSYTTSSSSTLDGWTHYNTTSAWGEYGAWSGWSTTAAYDSDSRDAESKDEHTGYHMIMYATKSTSGSRQFRSYSINGNYSGYGCSSSYGEFVHSRDASIAEVNSATTVAEGAYTSACSHPGYNKGNGTGYILPYGDLTYVYFINSNIYTTYYRYRDRSLIYTYYFYKTENLESTSYPSGENISEVQEWIQYRAK